MRRKLPTAIDLVTELNGAFRTNPAAPNTDATLLWYKMIDGQWDQRLQPKIEKGCSSHPFKGEKKSCLELDSRFGVFSVFGSNQQIIETAMKITLHVYAQLAVNEMEFFLKSRRHVLDSAS
jgi:hypothetical protein